MLRSIVRMPIATVSVQTVNMQSRRTLAVEVTAAMVKKLRELSGAPLMDCKHALGNEAVQGDLQKAMDWLRAKGISKVSSSTRETKEGLIGVLSHEGGVTLIEVNCETGEVDPSTFTGIINSIS
jgi:elongation factor Ts